MATHESEDILPVESEYKIVNPINKKNLETTIIATIARMNPPTPGHLLLVKKMILDAAQNNLTQITIILSHSVDSDENPLECETKAYLFLSSAADRLQESLARENPDLSEKINNVNVAILCMNEPFEEEVPEISSKTTPILKAINYILFKFYGYPRSGLTLKLFVGDDRDYSNFLRPSLEKKLDPVRFQQVQLERPAMTGYKSMNCDKLGELDVDKIPVESMSASLLRNLVKCRLPDPFAKVMQRAYLNDSEINELYGLLTDVIKEDQGINMGGGKKGRRTKKKRIRKNRRKNTRKKRSRKSRR
jgi:hypothetical protein